MPTNRKFGLFFGFIFLTASIYFLVIKNIFFCYSFSFVGLIFIILAIIKPSILKPFNFAWYGLGLILARVTSPLILAALFFLIITPVGLIMKLMGRDPLRLKDSNSESYWINRVPQKGNLSEFRDQF